MPGNIDLIDNYSMAGWACAPDRKRPSRMRVDVNRTPTYTLIPRDFRPDLEASGWADGYCSINFTFPAPLTRSGPVVVEVWNEETGELLTEPGLLISPDTGGQANSDQAGTGQAREALESLAGKLGEAAAGRLAPSPTPGSWEAAVATIARIAMERIAAFQREADSLHAEIFRLRAEFENSGRPGEAKASFPLVGDRTREGSPEGSEKSDIPRR
jgi:hypothetical protein